MFNKEELTKIIIGLDHYLQIVKEHTKETQKDLEWLQSEGCSERQSTKYAEYVNDDIDSIKESKNEINEIKELMDKVRLMR